MKRLIVFLLIFVLVPVFNVFSDQDSDIRELFASSKPDISQGGLWVKGGFKDFWFPGGERSTWTYESPLTGEKTTFVKTFQIIDGREYTVIKRNGEREMPSIFSEIFINLPNAVSVSLTNETFLKDKFNPLLTFRTVRDKDGAVMTYGYAKDYNDIINGQKEEAIEGIKKIKVNEEEWLLNYSSPRDYWLLDQTRPVCTFWVWFTDGSKKLFEVIISSWVEYISVPGGENYFVTFDFCCREKTGDLIKDLRSEITTWRFYLDDGGGIIGVEYDPNGQNAFLWFKLIDYSLTPEKKSGIGIDIPNGKVVTTWGNVKKQ